MKRMGNGEGEGAPTLELSRHKHRMGKNFLGKNVFGVSK